MGMLKNFIHSLVMLGTENLKGIIKRGKGSENL